MYMGFMKQGLSLMTIFATLCAVGIWLDIKPLLFFAPIILLYSFFRCNQQEFDGRRSV